MGMFGFPGNWGFQNQKTDSFSFGSFKLKVLAP